MKLGLVLSLVIAGAANAQQTGNAGPPLRRNPVVYSPSPQTDVVTSQSGEFRSADHGRRRRGWSQEQSGWSVGFHYEYREGGWHSPPPPCDPPPPVCPPPTCNETRVERVVVPACWVTEGVYDHCGRPLYDWRGCPVTRQVYVPGYTEIVTYRLERSRYWDGCCWRQTEQWVVCSRERVHC